MQCKMKNNLQSTNLFNIPCSNRKEFYQFWLAITRPFHKLAVREIEILALFLYKREQYLTMIDESLVDSLLLKRGDIKSSIREELGISSSYLQVVMSKFRDKGVIVNGRIDKKFIPSIDPLSHSNRLIFNFNIDDSKQES